MRRLLACLALAGLSLSAQAIPVTYDLTFTAMTGPSGSGELTWDSAASSMTGFSWDFGAGRQGGVLDSVLAEIAEGGPIGALLWEVLTGEDTHPFVFFSPSGSVGIFSAGFTAGSTYPVVAAYFFVNDEYHFVPASGPEDTGIVTLAQRATVPEPSMLTLLAFGLAGIGFTRFRRRSQPA